MSNPDVIFTIAHSPKSHGAVSACGKVSEHPYSKLLCDAAAEYVRSQGFTAEVAPPGTIEQKIKYVNERKPRCCVEPHLNASESPKPSGHMTIFHGVSARGASLAEAITRSLAVGLHQFRNIGACPCPSPQVRHPRLPYLADTVCPATITETLFVSNPKDVEYLLSDGAPGAIGMLIGEGVVQWLKAN